MRTTLKLWPKTQSEIETGESVRHSTLNRVRTSASILSLLTLLLIALPLQARSKTDVIHMKNGDRITCEIKKVERSKLTIKIDYMTGSHEVDWNEVERIESTQDFQVFWTDGEYSTGQISQQREADHTVTGEGAKKLVVSGEAGETAHDPAEVLGVDQLGRSFWEQLDFGIDFGFSFLKDNNQQQMTTHARVARMSRKRWFEADLSSFYTRRSDATDTNRHEANVSYLHFVSGRWFVGGSGNFLQSDQQELDLRTTLSAVGGRIIARNRKTTVALLGGGVLNRERFFQQESGTTNWEAVVGGKVDWFQFDSTEIQTNVKFYPSLSDPGRYRILFDTSAYLDLWGDLYVRLSFFDNFDSRPPTNTPGNDFGGSTTVGWSF